MEKEVLDEFIKVHEEIIELHKEISILLKLIEESRSPTETYFVKSQ